MRFVEHDASARLPFSNETFDAAYSNDAFCHIPNRLSLLRECRRVLTAGARLLFSDALVVNGALSNEEIAVRSSIGYYLFVPRGENERLDPGGRPNNLTRGKYNATDCCHLTALA